MEQSRLAGGLAVRRRWTCRFADDAENAGLLQGPADDFAQRFAHVALPLVLAIDAVADLHLSAFIPCPFEAESADDAVFAFEHDLPIGVPEPILWVHPHAGEHLLNGLFDFYCEHRVAGKVQVSMHLS